MNTLKNKVTTKPTEIKLNPNDINDYFINISKTVLTQENVKRAEEYVVPKLLIDYCNKKNPKEQFSIPFITFPEVSKLINQLKNNSSPGPENLPIKLIKLALPFIIEPLTYAYNLCLQNNTFPTNLKGAKVIPIPKKKDVSDPQNLRPISLLPILSKPLEKHIHTHMFKHLDDNKLLHEYQSGFRPKHSCHTALTRLIDTWLTSINQSEIVGTIFLDFRKAFGLVNHDILLKKIELYYPNSIVTSLIKSYLYQRYQHVEINGNKSKKS